MKIAAAAYPIDWLDDFDAYETKLTRWVADAEGAARVSAQHVQQLLDEGGKHLDCAA